MKDLVKLVWTSLHCLLHFYHSFRTTMALHQTKWASLTCKKCLTELCLVQVLPGMKLLYFKEAEKEISWVDKKRSRLTVIMGMKELLRIKTCSGCWQGGSEGIRDTELTPLPGFLTKYSGISWQSTKCDFYLAATVWAHTNNPHSKICQDHFWSTCGTNTQAQVATLWCLKCGLPEVVHIWASTTSAKPKLAQLWDAILKSVIIARPVDKPIAMPAAGQQCQLDTRSCPHLSAMWVG